MTCGACDAPFARSALDVETGGRVYGYLTAKTLTGATMKARDLYAAGAGAVFSDYPAGRLESREGWKTLSHGVYLRAGDVLILPDWKPLASRKQCAARHFELLEADRGVKVLFLNPRLL